VLASAGYVLRGVLRENDVVARWGGEEFLVVLPGQTQAMAVEVAERLRNALSQQETEGISFTASFGVASRSEQEAFEAWVARADRAMYEAKQAGRNCIRSAPLVQPLTLKATSATE
jgi:diguanylate cyclase (GGDEF)-like protein